MVDIVWLAGIDLAIDAVEASRDDGCGSEVGVAAAVGQSEFEASARRLVIDLPLVDLTDERLVDLADDGGAPMRAFQPCSASGGSTATPCEQCDGCRRWHAAFDAAGVAWPWTTVEGRADAA